MPRTKTTDNQTETPRDAFVRIASGRVTKALEALNMVAQTGNTRKDQVTAEDRDKVLAAVQNQMQSISDAWTPGVAAKKDGGFAL